MNHLNTKKEFLKNSRGFNLLEMIVVLALFSFLAVSLFAKNSSFNSSVVLTNLAYEVALSIRQAQVYGLSVREFEPGSNEFSGGYGINFNSNNSINYLFFADLDEDGAYDGSSELMETYSLRRANRIGYFCATTISGQERCSNLGEINYLNITFKRPNPDAVIKSNRAEVYKSAKIFVTSPDGSDRIIMIEDSGQISVEQES